ncbi:MAG: hypothetical protein ACI9GW_001025 [Halieaceae bacterium]|jgi:uncharacterized protein (DUF2164 family)
MPDIAFSKEETDIICSKIQLYFEEKLDQEIGMFDSQFLLDFFSEEIGSFYYNRGLHDALALFQNNMDSVGDAIYEVEKPTQFVR